MSEAVRLQDPAETLDHTFNWNDGWLVDGDHLTASSWVVTPTGPDITTTPATFSNTLSTVWVAGVTFGKLYEVRNTVVTASGRTGERSFTLRATRQ